MGEKKDFNTNVQVAKHNHEFCNHLMDILRESQFMKLSIRSVSTFNSARVPQNSKILEGKPAGW